MATQNKTTETEVSVADFLANVDDEQKRADSFRLVELMSEWSGFEAKMWGPTIIGFGKYTYQYASGHGGTAPMIGFSPRKPAFSLYVYSPTDKSRPLLDELGKYKISKACIYVKKLADVNIDVLKEMCLESIAYLHEHHECACREK